MHLLTDVSHFLIKLFFRQPEPFIAEYVDEHTIRVGDEDEHVDSCISVDWVAALGPSCLVIPLQVKQNDKTVILGGLILGNSTQPLTPADAEAALVFSDILSSSLYNARLLHQLNEMTIIDALTRAGAGRDRRGSATPPGRPGRDASRSGRARPDCRCRAFPSGGLCACSPSCWTGAGVAQCP